MDGTGLVGIDGEHLPMETLLRSPNIAEHLDDGALQAISSRVLNGWRDDESSRSQWMERAADSLKLAQQVTSPKSYPFAGASNVKFPLLTIGAIQYHSLAYPALVNLNNLVSYRVYGHDQMDMKITLGRHLSKHMMWQLLEESESWEPSTDRAFLVQAILGCCFKKVYYDSVRDRNVSELVLPTDLCVPYATTSIETADRISHLYLLSINRCIEHMRMGLFRDVDLRAEAGQYSALNGVVDAARQQAQGVYPTAMCPPDCVQIVEQECTLDLDGDGYAEPYAVTLVRDSGVVLRIVGLFTPEDIKRNAAGQVRRIDKWQRYIKYGFIPSPDNGFYDMGLGTLLGPINDSVDTLINQLIDAGTKANLGGGFLGRGVKIRGGSLLFAPGEWKQIDSTGDDIKKNMLPLPTPEPSDILFKLLDYLVRFGQLVVGATETSLGEMPGQNTPAETSRTALAQGRKVFSAIFKRTFRSMRDEFRAWWKLNAAFLSDNPALNPFGVARNDYSLDPLGVFPAADPEIVSEEQDVQRALMLAQRSLTAMLPYNRMAAEYNLLRALKVRNPEQYLPPPGKPGATPMPPNPKLLKVQVEAQKIRMSAAQFNAEMRLKQVETVMGLRETQARIDQLEAQAAMFAAKAQSGMRAVEVQMANAELAAARAHHEALLESLKFFNTLGNEEQQHADGTGNGGGTGGVAIPSGDGETDENAQEQTTSDDGSVVGGSLQ